MSLQRRSGWTNGRAPPGADEFCIFHIFHARGRRGGRLHRLAMTIALLPSLHTHLYEICFQTLNLNHCSVRLWRRLLLQHLGTALPSLDEEIMRFPPGMMLERPRWRSWSMAVWWIFFYVLPRSFEFLDCRFSSPPRCWVWSVWSKPYGAFQNLFELENCFCVTFDTPFLWFVPMCHPQDLPEDVRQDLSHDLLQFAETQHLRAELHVPEATTASARRGRTVLDAIGDFWKWWWLHTSFFWSSNFSKCIFKVRSRYCIFFVSSISHEILLKRFFNIVVLDLSSYTYWSLQVDALWDARRRWSCTGRSEKYHEAIQLASHSSLY